MFYANVIEGKPRHRTTKQVLLVHVAGRQSGGDSVINSLVPDKPSGDKLTGENQLKGGSEKYIKTLYTASGRINW